MGAQHREKLGHRDVFVLAWPIMVQMLSYTALTVVNSIYVGRLGTSELAAIGLASSLMYLVTAFGIGLLGSVRIHVANRTGAEEHAVARQFAWDGLLLAGLLGSIVATLAFVGPWVFPLMGGSAEVVGPASDYYQWRVLGSPILFLMMALTAAFQGRGDTRTPMVANLLANAINLVIDPALIFGFGPVPALGMAGAAIGAVLATVAGLLVLAWRGRRWLGWPPVPSRDRLLAIWRLGSPQAIQYQLDVASFSVFAVLLAGSGDDHLAAHVIVVRIVMVSFLPCHALGEAVSVLVGQSLGAGDPDRARRALNLAAAQAAGLMLTLGAVFVAGADALTAVFGASASVVAIARPVILLYAVFQVLDGLAAVTTGALSGAGDTRFVMRLTVLVAWFVKLPVAAALVLWLDLGALGAWIGICAEFTVQLAVAAWRARGAAWLLAGLSTNEAAPVPAK